MTIIPQIFTQAQRYKKIIFFGADILLIAFSVVLAFAIRFEGAIPGHYLFSILRLIILCELFTLPVYYYFRLYDFSWSYVSTQELFSLIRGTVLSFFLIILTLFVFREYQFFSGFPRSIVFISYFFIFVFCGGIRFAKRFYVQLLKAPGGSVKARTLIVGAGDAGEQIARSIISSPNSPYLAVGYVDDNPDRQNNLIHGIRVIGPIKKIPEIVSRYAVTEMIIALPSARAKSIKEAVEAGRLAGVKKIKVVPSLFEMINGGVSISQVREVDVEDLLERDPVTLDTESIAKFVKGKTVLITGAAGSIGSELCRQIARFNPKRLLMLDQDETGIFNISEELKKRFKNLNINPIVCDICDHNKINRVFDEFCPGVVFHAAAYKHVPLMESFPDEAVKNNIFGTKTVAEAALDHHAEKFVMISTDKAVNPSSAMGATKRVCEMVCQNLNRKSSTKFISVRFGNVLNSRGSVIPIFREQIKRGGPVEVTDPEMKRYFMLTSEACLLVMEAGAMGQGGEVFVLDMGKPIKIIDLACEMIRLSGFEPDKDIPIVFIGIRPGEKLFEEILTAEEGILATQNQKIFVAKLSRISEQELMDNLEKIKSAAQVSDKEKIIEILKKTVTNYV